MTGLYAFRRKSHTFCIYMVLMLAYNDAHMLD